MAYTATKISQLQKKSSINDTDVMIVSTNGVNTYQSTVSDVKNNFKSAFGIDSINSSIATNKTNLDILSNDLYELSTKTTDLSDLQYVKENKENISTLSADLDVISSEIDAFKSPNDTTQNTYHLIKTGFTLDSSAKNYPIKLDQNSNAYVNVPWQSSTSLKTADEVSAALDKYKLSVDQTLVPQILSNAENIEDLMVEVENQTQYGVQINTISASHWKLINNVYGSGFMRKVYSFDVNSTVLDDSLPSGSNDNVLSISYSTHWSLVGDQGTTISQLELSTYGITFSLTPSTAPFISNDVIILKYVSTEIISAWVLDHYNLVSIKSGDVGEISSSVEELSGIVIKQETTKLDSDSLSADEWTITYKDEDGNLKTIVKKLAMFTE